MKQPTRSAIEKAWRFRYLALAGVMVIGSVAIMTSHERAIVETKAVYLIGYASPALVMGAIIGWITFSHKTWLWTTVGLLALTVQLMLAC